MGTENKEQKANLIIIGDNQLTLDHCIDLIGQFLRSVRSVASDYYNSTSVISLFDEFCGDDGNEVKFQVQIDVKALGVVGAITQAALALRGSTDLGKTAIAERILTGLFGSHGRDWWRMEINRGITIDDLIDVDVETLSHSKLSEAIEGAKWLGKPARLLDEINRGHPKLLSLLIHLVDSSGFNVRGDLSIPVGQRYLIGDEIKRFSFCVATANQLDSDYAGVFEEDMALTRRIPLSIDLDEFPPTHKDRSKLLTNRRAKTFLQPTEPLTGQIICVYESLANVVPVSALAHLFLHYLAGRNTCVRSRCGRVQPKLERKLCENCHLAKSNRFCGRVGGLSEGLLLWTKELAIALAAVRASMVLEQVQELCSDCGSDAQIVTKIQRALGTKATGVALYEAFRRDYLSRLKVTGEDVKAAWVLVAPTHVWFDANWLGSQTDFECKPLYLFREVARAGWVSMVKFLRDYHALIAKMCENPEISADCQSELEEYITTKDAAALAVVSALRDEDLTLSFREELTTGAECRIG